VEHKPLLREDIYFVLTSLLHVVVVVLFGVLINISQLSSILPLVAFAISSKVFALVIGENKRLFAHSRWASLPLAAISLVILLFLPVPEIALGVAVMLLYLSYPQLIKARERSPLDVLFHGLRYAVLFWMGYYGGLNLLSATAILMVFLFGVTGELLVGLRSNQEWKTTAVRLGTANTVRIVNILIPALIILGAFLFSLEVDFPLLIEGVALPIPLLMGIALAIFMTRPVSIGRSHRAPISVRKREIISLLVCLMIIVALPVGARVNFTQDAPQPNYVVRVGMQTLVTGPHSWDGEWIIFNYSNQRNFYYIILHTNGTLELARFVNGVHEPNLKDAASSYSPFQWHEYEIQVINGTATIYIDGSLVMTAPVQGSGGEVLVTQSAPNVNIWVVWVTQFQVSAASQ
jgi:hypothetical protein